MVDRLGLVKNSAHGITAILLCSGGVMIEMS